MSLRKQFEKETGIVSWVKCDGTTLFTEDYTEWLEKLNTKLQQGLSANQHDTVVNGTEWFSIDDLPDEFTEVLWASKNGTVIAGFYHAQDKKCYGFFTEGVAEFNPNKTPRHPKEKVELWAYKPKPTK